MFYAIDSARLFREIAAALPLIAYRGIGGGMPILLGLFIAHRWGLGELAAYTVANAAITIAQLAVDWGAQRALPRNLAMLAPEGAARMLASVNAFRLLLVTVLFGGGAIAIATGYVDRGVTVYLTLLFPLCVLFLVTGNAVGERVVAGETRAISWAVAAGLIVFAIGGGIILTLQLGPRWFIAAYVAGKCVEAIGIVIGRWWVIAVRTDEVLSAAVAFWPFAAQAILGVIYSRLAIFTVERMLPRAELGVFSFAVALQGALMLVPVSLALIYFPELTRRTTAGDFPEVRRIVLRYTIISCTGIVMGVGVLASVMGPMGAMFKLPPGGAAFVVAFAAVSLLSVFSTMAGFRVQAGGRESIAARLSVVTLVCAAIFQITALKALGLWGIVVAAIAAELTTIVLFGFALRMKPAA